METSEIESPGFTQSGSPEALPEGWLVPQPETLPRPTYWPSVMAAGIILALGGLVTAWPILAAGLVLLAPGLGGWIGEIHHE